MVAVRATPSTSLLSGRIVRIISTARWGQIQVAARWLHRARFVTGPQQRTRQERWQWAARCTIRLYICSETIVTF
jgi:hypothetical protein